MKTTMSSGSRGMSLRQPLCGIVTGLLLVLGALSPASVRNVMTDLEEAGLIYSPHTSAGRLPTELGLRFYAIGSDALAAFQRTLARSKPRK